MPCALPTEVINDLPSGATAMPASSVGPDVNCSAGPLGNSVRQIWNPEPPTSLVRLDPFAVGDQAAEMQLPSGPMNASGSAVGREQPATLPVKGIHLDRDDRFSVWGNVGAVDHALRGARKINIMLFAARLLGGHEPM